MKIILIVATKCQILTLKCTKLDFSWGTAPDPAGNLQPSPDTLGGGSGTGRPSPQSSQCRETVKYVLILQIW